MRVLAMALILCAMSPPASGAAEIRIVESRTSALHMLKRRLQLDCDADRFAGVIKATAAGVTVFEHTCGLADIESGRPISPDAVFKAFSISKGVTGLVIMMLAEAGVIALDEPVSKRIPEVPAAWGGVTLRELLHHTSGLPDLTDTLLAAWTEQGATDHESAMRHALAAAESAPVEADASWRYNNFGYELLALAASRAAGRSYGELVRRKVFEVAGMRTASWEQPAPWRPSPLLAQGYNGSPGDPTPATSLVYVQQGAGALHVSADDLLALDQAWREGRLIGEPMSRRNVEDAVRASATVGYGYGWMVRTTAGGQAYLQHSGGNNGFTTEFARGVDQPVAVVVLSNRGYADPSPWRRELMDILLDLPVPGAGERQVPRGSDH